MTRTVSTTEAKNSLNALMSWAEEHGEAVIVENHGKPRVAIIPAEQLDEFQTLKREAVRREALEWMRQYEAKHGNANSDLSAEDTNELAVEASREIVDDLVAHGTIRFERDEIKTK
jgi:prevent-host-death family protein